MNIKFYIKISVVCILFSIALPVILLSVIGDTVVFTDGVEESFYDSLSIEGKEAYKAEYSDKMNWLEEVAFILTKVNPWPYYLVVFFIVFPISIYFYRKKLMK